MADRYFTPAEVEALIPALTEIMEDVMAAQAELAAVRERFHGEQERIAMTGGAVIDQDAWRDGKAALSRAGARIQERLEEITKLGGVTKDLGMGLVDFPHLREGKVVNLCWKRGERRITHWHGLEEGYANRKPL
jgi:hypothetical protein